MRKNILLRFSDIRTSNTNTLLVPLHQIGVAPSVVILSGGGGVHHLDLLLGGKEVPEDVWGVDRGVVLVEDEAGLHFPRPLLLHPLKKHLN